MEELRNLLGDLGISTSSSQEEVPFDWVYPLIIKHNLRSNEEAVQKFIFFEQPSANVNIETFCYIVNKKIDSFLKNFFLLCKFQSLFEKLHEVIQRVLIHRIDDAEVADHEVNDTTTFSNGSIFLSSFVYFLTGYFGKLDSLIHTFRSDLRCIQGIDKGFIFKDPTLGLTDLPENFIFQFLEFFLISWNLENEFHSFSLKFYSFKPDNLSK